MIELVDGRVHWRHPLVRAAVLHLLDVGRQRGLHRALAEAATDAGRHERALWHLSESVLGPDDAVAARMASWASAPCAAARCRPRRGVRAGGPAHHRPGAAYAERTTMTGYAQYTCGRPPRSRPR